MSAIRLSILNNVDTQKIYTSLLANTSGTASLPAFTGDERILVSFQALRGYAPASTGWERMATADYGGIQVIITDTAGAQLAYQNTFVAMSDGYTFEGTLSCGDAAFTTYVSTATPSSPKDGYFAIRIIDSDGNPRVSLPPRAVKLYKSLFAAAVPTVPATETPLSLETGSNIFFKNDGSSGPPILRSATKKYLLTIDENGQLGTQYAGLI